MSIEDINYLKENSIIEAYTFLVDSKQRNKKLYPTPSEYVIEFSTPFRHVIGIEVVDVSIPKTMYNIDQTNNKLYYYIASTEDDNKVNIIINKEGIEEYDKSMFNVLEVPPGDYRIETLVDKLRSLLKNIDLDIAQVSVPADLTNKIYFRSSKPFLLDMQQSTIREVLGFDLYTTENDTTKYKYMSYNSKIGFEQLYHSFYNTETGRYNIYSPGMMYLLGSKYIKLRCPEIEAYLYTSLAYSKYSLGLAKIRVNNYGYNDEKTSFLKIPIKEFHPIGKLSKMTLRFETDDGELYDFKGVNHNIMIAIYYYVPKPQNTLMPSILNPDYDPNFIAYQYKQEEQETESDSENDFSRDNINIYKTRKSNYDKEGIAFKNKLIANTYKKQQDKKDIQNAYLNRRINNIKYASSTEESD